VTDMKVSAANLTSLAAAAAGSPDAFPHLHHLPARAAWPAARLCHSGFVM